MTRLIPFALLAAGTAAMYVLMPYNLAFATRILVMGIFVLSIDLVLGFAGIATLGQAAMYGAGAYGAALFAAHVWAEPVVGLVFGAGVGALVALVSGLILMRATGLTLIMLTIAVAALLSETANRARDLTGGADGLRVTFSPVLGLFEFDFIGQTGFWYAACVGTIVLGLLVIIARSPFGLSLKGLHASAARMSAIGAPVYPRKVAAYTLGGAIAGVAGAVSAQVSGLVSLETFSFTLSAEALIMLILGGTGRLWGALLGTVLFMFAHHYAAATDPFNWLFAIGAMVMLVVFVLPQGLLSLPKTLKGGRND